jgi:hypothetical protein
MPFETQGKPALAFGEGHFVLPGFGLRTASEGRPYNVWERPQGSQKALALRYRDLDGAQNWRGSGEAAWFRVDW